MDKVLQFFKNGKLMSLPTLNLTDPAEICAVLHNATEMLFSYEGRVGNTHHVPPVGNMLVSGDLHDNPPHLAKIIKLADLDDPRNHVVLQELIHSGGTHNTHDLSYQMLVRVAALVVAYPLQVHPILANHELSQVTGRGITKGGGELVEAFIRGINHVFGVHADDVLAAINAFVYAMPLAVRSKSGLMCCHSLPNDALMESFDMDVINREFLPEDVRGGEGSAYMMVWGRQHTQEQIDTLAAYWGVKLFCLGHAWVPDGVEVAMDKMLLINSDHDNGVALPVCLDTIHKAGITAMAAVKLETISVEQHDL